ncbi:hypothetical protein [Dactylosporangium sp. NPDC051484]|uniref:hypothetical protein n=1 Tax=Dactylosporangium sp. NPDC051484 TaxID=3154942 RepID=UPI00344BBDEE
MVGTLFSIDPVIGALVGLLILDQAVRLPAVAGIGLVVVAGAAIVWMSEASTPPAADTPSDRTDTSTDTDTGDALATSGTDRVTPLP